MFFARRESAWPRYAQSARTPVTFRSPLGSANSDHALFGKGEREMTVAIIGFGNMGKALARRLTGQVDLIIGTSDPAEAQPLVDELGADILVTNHKDAARQADIVVLALPFNIALEEARSNGSLDNKVVVDISNPTNPDYSGLALGYTTSAAEEIEKAVPGARVVKAFNTIFASVLDSPADATADVPVFIAGNDPTAVEAVADLVGKAGFAVERVGGLDGARLLEPVGMLNIRLGYGLGKGTSIAPSWLSLAA
jgi:8-hydroxy-5-deazaflavin:NADPH oxidoreductase